MASAAVHQAVMSRTVPRSATVLQTARLGEEHQVWPWQGTCQCGTSLSLRFSIMSFLFSSPGSFTGHTSLSEAVNVSNAWSPVPDGRPLKRRLYLDSTWDVT